VQINIVINQRSQILPSSKHKQETDAMQVSNKLETEANAAQRTPPHSDGADNELNAERKQADDSDEADSNKRTIQTRLRPPVHEETSWTAPVGSVANMGQD
jgi:hypothetical protein